MNQRTSLKFYDPNGKEIEGETDMQIMLKVDELLHDPEVSIVKQELLPNGLYVSTVWIYCSIEEVFGGPPLIYETMVFQGEGGSPVGSRRRYPNTDEAKKGHEEVVAEHIRKVN